MIYHLIFNFIVILLFSVFIFINTDFSDWRTPNSKKLTFTDAIYLCLTSFSTVGYGDIIPKSNKAKIILITLQSFVIIEILSSVEFFRNKCFNINFFIKIIVTYVLIIVATLYFLLFTKKEDWSFPTNDQDVTFLNMFYLSNSTLSTCGYGDIVPLTLKTRIPVMMIQSIIILQIMSLIT